MELLVNKHNTHSSVMLDRVSNSSRLKMVRCEKRITSNVREVKLVHTEILLPSVTIVYTQEICSQMKHYFLYGVQFNVKILFPKI